LSGTSWKGRAPCRPAHVNHEATQSRTMITPQPSSTGRGTISPVLQATAMPGTGFGEFATLFWSSGELAPHREALARLGLMATPSASSPGKGLLPLEIPAGGGPVAWSAGPRADTTRVSPRRASPRLAPAATDFGKYPWSWLLPPPSPHCLACMAGSPLLQRNRTRLQRFARHCKALQGNARKPPPGHLATSRPLWPRDSRSLVIPGMILPVPHRSRGQVALKY
jgi:hypothetical protein